MSNFFVVDKTYKTYLGAIGVNDELVFKKAGIPYRGMSNEGVVLDKKQYIAFMKSMDTYTRDEHILIISDASQWVMFVPPLYAAMCASDGNSCFDRISTYKKLIGPFALLVKRDQKTLSLEFVFDEGETEIPRFTVLTEQVLMVGILREATGLNIVPTKVGSVHDYGDGIFEDYFGIKPEKGPNNILSFRLEDMEEPFLTSNNTMWRYLEPELKKRIQELETDESFSAKVRSTLFEFIPAGEDSVETVAHELAVSPRTLQRRLSEEKTTFIKQLNHTRELMARNYLKDSTISPDEVAFLVGYSDANAFGRAFRNWTGMTVGVYKKKISV